MPRRGYRNGHYLFHEYDMFGVQQATNEQLRKMIESADAVSITTGTVDDVAKTFVQKVRLDVPDLTEGAISVDVEEAAVDVSGDHMRAFYDGDFRSGPRLVPGIRATYFVPYRGDKDFFKIRPNTYTLSAPIAVVEPNELVFQFERGDQNVAATKADFDRQLGEVKQYLGWLHQNADTFNATLPTTAKNYLTSRRNRLAELQKGTDGLGIPIRRAGTPPPSPATRPSAPKPPAPTASEHYDVALTFAGEDRPYVEKVATGLKEAGVGVFYDVFEKANLWGKNLVEHLAEIYQKRSRYVVMFISEHYVTKAWPQHERQHAQARALVAKEEYILPARFDDTEVPGMTNTVGHVDLRTTTAQELVELILKKLGKK